MNFTKFVMIYFIIYSTLSQKNNKFIEDNIHNKKICFIFTTPQDKIKNLSDFFNNYKTLAEMDMGLSKDLQFIAHFN